LLNLSGTPYTTFYTLRCIPKTGISLWCLPLAIQLRPVDSDPGDINSQMLKTKEISHIKYIEKLDYPLWSITFIKSIRISTNASKR
jgi:hypothetical protein